MLESGRFRLLPAGLAAAAVSLLLMLSLASSAEALEEHKFCWGASVEWEKKCSSANWYMNAAYASSPEGRVCISMVELSKCANNINEGVYAGYGGQYGRWTSATLWHNLNKPVKVYGVFWTAPPPPGGGGGGGGESPPPPPAESYEGRWWLRNSNISGNGEFTFLYGSTQVLPVSGDWNGDGFDTPGVYDPATSTWALRNYANEGNAELTFQFGTANNGGVPVVGDWNNDGKDSIGLYNPATGAWYLRNTNSIGYADAEFLYGAANAGYKPVVGDWNGDGSDTIGFRR